MKDMNQVAQTYVSALEKQQGDEQVLANARARFAETLHGIDNHERAPSRWRFVVPAIALAAAALVAGVFFWPEAPLQVSLRNHPGQPADFVNATASEEAVDFSDGSELIVRADSQMRIAAVTAEGAQVSLERGAAHVSVVHQKKTKWTFSAGPYRVHVIGTKFELKWNPDTAGIEVAMDEGIVEVDGPGLARQRVTTRQKLEAFANPPRASLYLEAPAVDEDDAVAEGPRKTFKRNKKPAPEVKPPELKAPPSGPSWRYLADTGDDFGAMNAADQAGFTWLTNSMPKADVLLLGDVARKAKQPARAKEAWLAVRERFPGSAAATEAAIRLGSLATEVERDDASAVKWFSKAVREAPNGSTAPDAMGRWLELLVKSGNQADAKKVATDYLKRFPNGPLVGTARDVLH